MSLFCVCRVDSCICCIRDSGEAHYFTIYFDANFFISKLCDEVIQNIKQYLQGLESDFERAENVNGTTGLFECHLKSQRTSKTSRGVFGNMTFKPPLSTHPENYFVISKNFI